MNENLEMEMLVLHKSLGSGHPLKGTSNNWTLLPCQEQGVVRGSDDFIVWNCMYPHGAIEIQGMALQ